MAVLAAQAVPVAVTGSVVQSAIQPAALEELEVQQTEMAELAVRARAVLVAVMDSVVQ